MFSVNDKQPPPYDYNDGGYMQHQENDHPILSSSLNFLSHDQKVALAERSSMASGQPGAFSQTGEEFIARRRPIKSQDEILKNMHNIHQHKQSSLVDDDRKPPPLFVDDPLIMSSSEVSTLEEFQEQMNRFQHNFELEIHSQVEGQLLQEKNRRKRLCWGICAMILLFVLILSLAIPLAMKSHTDHGDIPINLESLSSIEKCYTGKYRDQNRYNNVRSFLTSYYPNLTVSINEVGAIANVALCWLSQYDKLDLNPYPIYADTLAQRFVLVMLYFHFIGRHNLTSGSDTLSKQNWLSMQDVCDWTLVGCQDNVSSFRYVTSLDFSKVVLKKMQLPSEIALLRNLTKLNFNPNVLEGTIPLELSSLTLLEEFSVMNWGSESINLIDKIIRPWNYLERLSLEISFPSLLPDVGAKTNLKSLVFMDHLKHYVYDFPNVQELSMLETLTLDLFWAGDIPSYLWHLSNLENLTLPAYAQSIASDIGKMSKLKELIIGGQIPSEIGSLSQLEYLFIETTHKVPSEIGMLTKLENFKAICTCTGGSQPLAKEICALGTKFNLDGCFCN